MKFRWDKKYLYTGVTAFIVIVASLALLWIFTSWDGIWSGVQTVAGILSPVFYGLVIAYILSPLCNFMERHGLKAFGEKCFPDKPRYAFALTRSLSITGAVAFALLMIALLLYMILPQVFFSVKGLVNSTSVYVDSMVNWVTERFHDSEFGEDIRNILNTVYDGLINWLQKTLLPQMETLLGGVLEGAVNVVRGLFDWVMGIVIAVYLLYGKEKFIAQSKKVLYSLFPPRPVNTLLKNATLTHKMFGGFITAKLVDSLIIGVMCYVFMLIFRMPYAPLISVLVGVTNIIPVFGPFIGAIPSALLILLESPLQCLWFVIFILALQQFDGNFLGPKLMGNTTGLNSFWVMVALLLGGGFFGLLGMLCGVPLFAVIYALVRTACEGRLRRRRLPVETTQYRDLTAIDMETLQSIYAKNAKEKPKAKKPTPPDKE